MNQPPGLNYVNVLCAPVSNASTNLTREAFEIVSIARGCYIKMHLWVGKKMVLS